MRHGEAACTGAGVGGGPQGCRGLTARGRAQAGALADRLARSRELADVSAVYTSVLPRAIETATILERGLPRGLAATQDCELCELHPGEADGLTWEALQTRFGGPDWDADPDQPFAPGGESWLGFYHRCVAAFGRIVAAHPGERVVLVVHSGVIEQVMKVAGGASAALRMGLRTEHASMTEVEFDAERRRLLRYNDRAPLFEA